MRTMPKKCNVLGLPDECIIFRNKKYYFRENGKTMSDLPILRPSLVGILEELNIPYKKEDGMLVYWDEDTYEATKVSGPVYLEKNSMSAFPSYEYVGRKSVERPTKESREAARKLEELVNNKVEEFERRIAEDAILVWAKEALKGKAAATMYHMSEMDTLDEGRWDEYTIEREDICLKLVRLYRLIAPPDHYGFDLADPSHQMHHTNLFIDTNYVVVFDMGKCKKSPVEIYEPTNPGLVIGKKGWQVRRLSRLIKRRIDVKCI